MTPSDFSSCGYFSLLRIKMRRHDFYQQNKSCPVPDVTLTANSVKSEKLYPIAVLTKKMCLASSQEFSRTAADKLTCITLTYLFKLLVHCAGFPSRFLTPAYLQGCTKHIRCFSPHCYQALGMAQLTQSMLPAFTTSASHSRKKKKKPKANLCKIF